MNTLKIKKTFAFLLLICVISACQKEDLSNADETIYVRNNGSTMPAYIYGNVASKTLIVVLHGGPGGNGLEYRFGDYASELEKNYGMVYFDQRGQGMSQGKYDAAQLTIDDMVEDVHALIQTLKVRYGNDTKIILYGHSWGGLLGTAYLLKADYQNEVAGWIESNGAHDLPRLNKASVALFIEVADQQIAKGNSVTQWEEIRHWATAIDTTNITDDISSEINAKGFDVEEYLKNDGEIRQSSGSSSVIKSLFFSPLNPLTSFITGNATNTALNEEIEKTALTANLPKITIPCLFLFSKYDFVVPAVLGRDAFGKVSAKNKQFVLFQSSGHSPMDNEPQLYSDSIEKFINSIGTEN